MAAGATGTSASSSACSPTRARRSSRSCCTSPAPSRQSGCRKRIADPTKRWKFTPEDIDDRRRFDDIEAAYEQAITKTSTAWAPWYVVPADHRWVRNAAITRLLLTTLRDLRPEYPKAAVDLSQIEIV